MLREAYLRRSICRYVCIYIYTDVNRDVYLCTCIIICYKGIPVLRALPFSFVAAMAFSPLCSTFCGQVFVGFGVVGGRGGGELGFSRAF